MKIRDSIHENLERSQNLEEFEWYQAKLDKKFGPYIGKLEERLDKVDRISWSEVLEVFPVWETIEERRELQRYLTDCMPALGWSRVSVRDKDGKQARGWKFVGIDEGKLTSKTVFRETSKTSKFWE